MTTASAPSASASSSSISAATAPASGLAPPTATQPAMAAAQSRPPVEIDYAKLATYQPILDLAIALKATPDQVSASTIVPPEIDDDGVLGKSMYDAMGEQQLAIFRKYHSIGSALKSGDAPAFDFLLGAQFYEDLHSRSPYQAKETFKDMLQRLVFFSLAEGNVDTLKVLYKYAPLVDIDLAKSFLDRFPLPSTPGAEPRYISAPFLAVEQGKYATLEWLLRDGKVDFATLRGGQDESLFVAAVLARQFEVADHLLALAPDPSAMLNETIPLFEQTAMHLAAQVGNLEALAYLVYHGADPTLASSSNNIASEFLPETDEYTEDYNALEDYRESFSASAGAPPFVIPEGWYASSQDKDGNVVLPVWLGGDPLPTDDDVAGANSDTTGPAPTAPKPSF